MDLNKMQKLVYQAILDVPGAADDDSLLQATVWERQGFAKMYAENGLAYALSRVSRADSLTRRRRELYEAKLISYSIDSLKMREDAFENEKEARRSVHTLPKAISWLND